MCKSSEGDTLGVQFFTAFCNHWHCTCAMALSLLCNHWQFLLGFSAMAKQNQNPKKTRNQKKMTRPNSLPLLPPLGCAILFFLVSWFFGFLFSGSLLVFWRGKDLDLTLCQFSHFRGFKLAFGWFYYLLWACGSIRKQCKKLWQNAGITGGSLGGLGHKLGNFVCLCSLSKTVLNNAKT